MRLAVHAAAGLLLASVGVAGCHPSHADSAAREASSGGPELFGAGLFSTGAWDFCLTLAPDETRALFCRADDAFTSYEILETERGSDGQWSAPSRPSFARQWNHLDPHLTVDATKVFFVSNRPLIGDGTARETHDLWFAERGADGGWRDAQRLPEPINLPGVDTWGVSMARSGNLYFGAERPGGKGGADLWVARWVDGAYQPPENLGDAVNTSAHEVDAWIARDESHLFFAGLNRTDAVGSYDLYVSLEVDGRWQEAQPLRAVNTAAYEFTPSVSPDGQWLYFSSTRPHTGPLGERLDAPRDERLVAGIGDGRKGDLYRIRMDVLGIRMPDASR